MTAEEVKKTLDKIRYSTEDIQKKKNVLASIELSTGPSAIRYDKDPVQSSPSNYNESAIIKATELREEITEDYNRIDKIKREMFDRIMQLKAHEEKSIIIYYYYDCLSYQETGNKIGLSLSSVYRWEESAIQNLASI